MLVSATLLFFPVQLTFFVRKPQHGRIPACLHPSISVYSNNRLPFIVYIASEVKCSLKIYNQWSRTVTYGNLIPGIYYAYLVFTMSISLGVFLALNVEAIDATKVPFIIGKLLSTFEHEFVFLASVKFLPV